MSNEEMEMIVLEQVMQDDHLLTHIKKIASTKKTRK